MQEKAREENRQTDYGQLFTHTHRHRDGTPTSEAAEEIIARIEQIQADLRASQTPESQGFEVHGEKRGMRYGNHLPRTSQVGNQLHQDDPINEVVRDAFGVQDDNFTAEVQGPEPVFFRNDAPQEFFSHMDESDRPLCQEITPNGLLKLTNETKQEQGHAFYPNPIAFHDSSSFSTTFVFAIRSEYKTLSCHGIVFVISPAKAFPGAFPGSRFQNLNLSSGLAMQVWVDYDGGNKQISVTLAPINVNKPKTPLLTLSQDLSQILNNLSYVGFSSGTGPILTSHYVLGWSFKLNGEAQNLVISELPKLPRLGPRKISTILRIGLPLLSLCMIFLVTSSVVYYIYWKRKFSEIQEEWEEDYGAHRFKYRDLYVATKGFKDKELLGSGGFGRVYKGTMSSSKLEVAVKKVSHESRQGMKEFVAEIISIGRFRHRNLVPLLGYCRRKGELLLVYDFMPNGSLDKYLHNQPNVTLNWTQRFKIIKGVALGLHYLHEESEKVVVHRDIKASNILLDSELNGRIGDFGLARLYDHGSDPQTTHVVGTWGYLAPEQTRTGRATTRQEKGHAFYPNPIVFNGSSFSTSFVFAIRSEYKTLSGHGIAFVISPAKALPGYYFSRSQLQNLTLISGLPMQVWVDYNGGTKQISVTLAPINVNKPETPLLTLYQDLSQILNNRSYVGFSSSTGSVLTSHYVLGWSFKLDGMAQNLVISKLPKLPRLGGGKKSMMLPIGLPFLSLCLIFLLTLSSLYYIKRKKKFSEILEDWEQDYGAQRFKYKDLYVATKGFKDRELLGMGGFGRVYKGTMPSSKLEVAVKKVSHESRQGMREFVAEIVSIGRLRHRNLVPLLGYCRRKGELLLVYDFMPNGSLDKYLYNQPRVTLNWRQRFKIIKGVALGLCYLHEECEKVVIHRDIKASNVLLDSQLNGRLGDFGLARLYDHGSDPQTTHVVGTLGYLAPEQTRTGRNTTRPSMRQVVQYLNWEVPLPDLSSLRLSTSSPGLSFGLHQEFPESTMSFPSFVAPSLSHNSSVAESLLSGGR
ncbi:hypothetical protein K1719_016682 [Acacia pycnantha]|nr:hypothetical protein K1719_016682 [Acacia pycnantha]